ncbi:MAG: hypothetical protein A2X18_07655 [Bacteroidetes bacterium GWF2_40_14]|nr:MAG: hypothetical protein A2X18_07655 [Bacteroidetes bacterium GWF2_40_14]
MEEDDLISKIVKRAQSELHIEDGLSLSMDLSATHSNGTPIDFVKLLGFDQFNFAHDITGIMNCIDRTDGTLQNFFLPRSSR